MMEKDAKLLSKLSLMISENEFHALLHAQGKNQTDYYHYHDYYEILFYLGEREVRYEKEVYRDPQGRRGVLQNV